MTKITGFKIKDFCGSNTLWNYVMVNASLRSHITHHDQSGLSRPFLWGTRIITTQYIYKCVKVNKAINELKTKIFQEGPMPMGLHGG
jgi:hypothetical protein